MVKYYISKKMCASKDVTFLGNLYSNLSNFSYTHTHRFLFVYAIIYYYTNPKSAKWNYH